MRAPNFIKNSLSNVGARGEFLWREIARNMHKPAQWQKIDS